MKVPSAWSVKTKPAFHWISALKRAERTSQRAGGRADRQRKGQRRRVTKRKSGCELGGERRESKTCQQFGYSQLRTITNGGVRCGTYVHLKTLADGVNNGWRRKEKESSRALGGVLQVGWGSEGRTDGWLSGRRLKGLCTKQISEFSSSHLVKKNCRLSQGWIQQSRELDSIPEEFNSVWNCNTNNHNKIILS